MARHYGLAGRVGWRSGWSLRWAGTAALGLAGLLGCAKVARAQEPAPDNSKTNQRDRDKAAAAADKQKTSPEGPGTNAKNSRGDNGRQVTFDLCAQHKDSGARRQGDA